MSIKSQRQALDRVTANPDVSAHTKAVMSANLRRQMLNKEKKQTAIIKQLAAQVEKLTQENAELKAQLEAKPVRKTKAKGDE